MAERIVEVEWEDSCQIHGWADSRVSAPKENIVTAGYLEQDNEEGVVLVFSKDKNKNSADPWGCSMYIPRSAIRKVTELGPRRKR